ncbi:MAG: hypothetical protein KC414_03440 [Romboutsia sp.]|nr:hypothetical protein [Romboutsia sp.]
MVAPLFNPYAVSIAVTHRLDDRTKPKNSEDQEENPPKFLGKICENEN